MRERVKKGQIIARLDREQVEKQRDRVRATVEAAVSRVTVPNLLDPMWYFITIVRGIFLKGTGLEVL